MKLQYFDRAQIRSNVAEVRKKWGQMWDFCGPQVRKALIEQHVLTVVLTPMGDTIDKAMLRECRSAMLLEAELITEDDV